MAIAGTSVKLKRLRRRFGINAPKLAIRTQVPWYWRALAAVALIFVSLVLAAWIYDTGRRFSGFHSEESSREIQGLREKFADLDSELRKLRSLAGSGESALQIERATQQQLALQVRALESENAELKQDLAFFEGLIPSSEFGGEVGVRINRLRIDPESGVGQYRYRMLLVYNGGRQQAKDFKGVLQLLVKMQQGGKDVMIAFPSETDQNPQRLRVEIAHFQRAEGTFSVPSGAVLKGVEARLLQDGVVRARQSVTL